MLKAMRRNIKSLSPILWLVIAAFIITIFAVWGGAGRLGQSRATGPIVRVGKEKISTEFYFQNLRQRLEALKREFKDLDRNLIQQLNIPQQVLEEIIQQTLLLQKAQELGIDASDGEIREKIMGYPIFQRDGRFVGFEEYKRVLDWNRISISEFEKSLKKEIVINKVIKVFTAGITVTPEELWESYESKNESAKMEFVILETDKIELKEEASLNEIQEYFKENKEKYKIPEKREAAIVFLKTEDLKSEIELAKSEIEKYYKENQAQFENPKELGLVESIFLMTKRKKSLSWQKLKVF